MAVPAAQVTRGWSGGTRWMGIVFALVIAPYGLLTAFANPGADDLTYALDTRRDGYLVALRDQYFAWNGRYASNLFELGGPMVWGSIAAYKIVAAAMILGTAIAAYVFVRAMVGDAWARGQMTTGALGLTALFLAGVPGLGESIYWYTGSATYQLSAILLLVLATLVIGAVREASTHRRWRVLAAVALTVVVVGMNEVAMVLIGAFYASLLVAGALERPRRTMTTVAALLGVALLSGLVVWLAPGNAVRSALFPARHQALRSMAMTMVQTVRFAADWSTNGSLLLATVLYLPLGAALPRATLPGRLGDGRTLLLLMAGTFGVIPLAVFPAYWASGALGQHRTISVAYFVFLPLWFTTVTAALAGGWLPAPDAWLANRRVQAAGAILLLLSLAFTHNGYSVAVDFAYGRPAQFDREMSSRLAALRACGASPNRVCVVPPLSVALESFLLPDLSADPGFWVNAGYAGYFGLRQVVAGREP